MDTKGYIKCVNSAPLTLAIKKGEVLTCINSKLNTFCKVGEPHRIFGINRMLIGDYAHTIADPDEFLVLPYIET